jgi:hypothetical protein
LAAPRTCGADPPDRRQQDRRGLFAVWTHHTARTRKIAEAFAPVSSRYSPDLSLGVSRALPNTHAIRMLRTYKPTIGAAKIVCVIMSPVGVTTAATMKIRRNAQRKLRQRSPAVTSPSREERYDCRHLEHRPHAEEHVRGQWGARYQAES